MPDTTNWPEPSPNALDELLPWGKPLTINYVSTARTMMQAVNIVSSAEGDEKLTHDLRISRLKQVRDSIDDYAAQSGMTPDHQAWMTSLVKHFASVSILFWQIGQLIQLKREVGEDIDMAELRDLLSRK